jgi:superfamily II DNA or RNA helicase
VAQDLYYYRHGLAVLHAVRERPPEWMAYDPRLDAHVAPGHRFPELRRWAADRGVPEVADDPEVGGQGRGSGAPSHLSDERRPRDYQVEALDRWLRSGGRGSVVLPTGSGKSLVALHAIHRTGGRACVVAPTRALVSQWFSQLVDAFGAARVGAWYGDEKEARPITVTTYHSAFPVLERFGRGFELVVLDEVHHLADAAASADGGKAWHDALRIAPVPHLLGLTATYPDGRDQELVRLVGPVVYRRRLGEMVDQELADLALERRFVSLAHEERLRYDEAVARYESFVEGQGYRDRFGDESSEWWPVFMAETRRSPAARRAFAAFRERNRIVDLAEGKVAAARHLLGLFPSEQAILFCASTEAAEALSIRFAVPAIRAETPASERKWILDAMGRGDLRAVVSVRVLDEGWDVPGAKLAIVLGGSRGRRQHRQRLGRILRRQGDRVASLFEIVASDTHEFFTSQRRRGGLGPLTDRQLGLGL